jgi:lipopolysaccharide/colanic/teichoic acid biosynthesis glycosyltransferase
LIKRTFDVVCSLLGLLLLLPILVALAVLIKLGSRGPVFYRGKRVGRLGKRFHIYKFRTMVADAEKLGGSSTPEDDPRVTRIGVFLRKYKLDELPQLINVLWGDMSLVGPRPQVEWAVGLYTEKEKALLSVRPGITDYASIKFNNEGDVLRGSTDPDKDYMEKIAPEKIRLGLEYVKAHSLWVDLRIILATLWSLLGGNPARVLGFANPPSESVDQSHQHEAV